MALLWKQKVKKKTALLDPKSLGDSTGEKNNFGNQKKKLLDPKRPGDSNGVSNSMSISIYYLSMSSNHLKNYMASPLPRITLFYPTPLGKHT